MSEVVVIGSASGLAQTISSGKHRLAADEPIAAGGTDTGPSPYDFLLIALGSCTSMTLRLYADRKGWRLDKIVVRLRHDEIYSDDCAECETRNARIDRIKREIELEGALDAAQRERLLEIANKCPVHRTLSAPLQVETSLTSSAADR
jgi:uncharacterized OsmC-like protein